MDAERLAHWFRRFAEVECPELPFYRTLCLGLADDRSLLDLLLTAAPGQWRPNLLLAALHDLVMRHPDDAFSTFYGTVGGSFVDGQDPLPSARLFIGDHRADVERLVATKSTQTNEVNRSCLWHVALRTAAADTPGQPVTFVEVGASAGLNLLFDRYSYRFGETSVGPDDPSGDSVDLACDLTGGPDVRAALDIGHRVGLDRSPVDLSVQDERRWLKACIWPEQPERHRRFDAAADLAVATPPRVVADDAVDGIADLVETCPGGTHIVIAHSWVMTYLSRERRDAFATVVDLLGADRTLTLVSAEGEGVVDWVPRDPNADSPHTVVGMRRYRDGNRTEQRVASCHPHLRWLRWEGGHTVAAG